jgi:hypothetical protein
MIAALKDFTLSFSFSLSFPHLMLTQQRPLITAKSNKLYICDGWEREREREREFLCFAYISALSVSVPFGVANNFVEELPLKNKE